MDHTSLYIKQIIIRFLEGTAEVDEITVLENWLKQNEANRLYFDEVNTAYQASLTLNRFNQIKIDNAWKNVTRRIEVESATRDRLISEQASLSVLKIAATLFLICLTGTYLFDLSRSEIKGSELVSVSNNEEKIKNIQLPDGSSVCLNKNGRLQYKLEFDHKREVSLIGEAYFDVKKNNTPFIVKTGNVSIQVKGTRFNVQNDNNGSVETTLESGKVELHLDGKEKFYVMMPGDQIIADNEHNKIVFKKVNPRNFSAWKEDRLAFDNIPLGEIITRLENRYAVTIYAADRIAREEKLSMTIENESLEEVLELIQLSSHLKLKKENDRFVLYK